VRSNKRHVFELIIFSSEGSTLHEVEVELIAFGNLPEEIRQGKAHTFCLFVTLETSTVIVYVSFQRPRDEKEDITTLRQSVLSEKERKRTS
jgi:hypothetical protein